MPKVFISYVRDNEHEVKRLYDALTNQKVDCWLDRKDISPGDNWKDAIRRAIRDGSFFIACFSQDYHKRKRSYMNEELTLAIEEIRQRQTDQKWFIPVKLSECMIPDRDIGGGRSLRDLQWADLHVNWDSEICRILSVIKPGVRGAEETSEFKSFWSGIADQPLTVITPVHVLRPNKAKYPHFIERKGVSVLENAFQEYHGSTVQIQKVSSGDSEAETAFRNDNTILSGGAVSNNITRQFFNHMPQVRYAIGYSFPEYDIWISDRKNRRKVVAVYDVNRVGERTLERDFGILSVLRNPVDEKKTVVGCMGIHAPGTFGCYRVLSEPPLLKQLRGLISKHQCGGQFQILIEYDVRHDLVKLRNRSFSDAAGTCFL